MAAPSLPSQIGRYGREEGWKAGSSNRYLGVYNIQHNTRLTPVLKSRSDAVVLSQTVTQYDNRDQ